MKKILIIFLIFISYLNSFSQPYGNEWINYNQKYFKFPVVKNGIYRISRTTLVNADISIDGTPLSFLRLYNRGQEQYIYIKENNLGILEYIEFYGQKNDGWFDSTLYKPGYRQANENFSLINDTAFYYITLGTTSSTKRYTIETDVNFSSYQTLSYCLRTELQNYTFNYYSGKSGPEYTDAEGWFDYEFGLGGASIKTINTSGVKTNAGYNAELDFALVTANSPASSFQNNHHIQVVAFNNTILDTSLYGYKLIKKKYAINSSSLSNNTVITFKSINDLGASVDRIAVAYVKLKYPRNFDFTNNSSYLFKLPVFTGPKATIEISNFVSSGGNVLYDLTNKKKLTTIDNSGVIKAVVPNSYQESELIINSIDSIINVLQIKPVNGTGNFNNFLIYGKNSNFLIISHLRLWSEAQNYQSYRNLKGYSTALINIDELYDQFSYGINKHPVAIKNFVNFATNNWTTKPEYLLLLGKSFHSHFTRFNTYYYAGSLVPSFGNPASDNLLTAGLNNSLVYEQYLATGRISAKTTSNVKTYLDKLKEFEANQPDEWMKNVIHFGGGNTSGEQLMFSNYLRSFESVIEDTLFGGNVSSFFKQTSSPIQITQTDSVKNLMNTGTSIITFFGHGSSTAGFDQNIDHPSNFNNRYKYPLLIANSCIAGDIHLDVPSVNEEWIFIQNKGAIGFLASVGEAYAQYLFEYTSELYKNIGYKKYGNGLGKCIKNTSKNYIQTYGNNSYVINTCLEFTLHGDPAVVLNSPEKPDLKLTSSSIKLSPNNISSENDTISVSIIVTNIGRTTTQEFVVELKRTFPDGTYNLYTKVMTGCIFKDTIVFRVPIEHIKSTGVNSIYIIADLMNDVNEISELNNTASIDFIIISGDITPIYPYKYAIVPNSQISLKASTGNPFANSADYIFQIDTTDLFNSSQQKTKIINSTGGVVSWALDYSLTDSTVYYWRVSAVPTPPNDYSWKESSFIYIPNKTGWSQSHFYQFKNNSYDFIDFNRNQRSFDFITSPRELHCHNIGTPVSYAQFDNIKFTIDNAIYDGLGDYTCCGASSAMMVVVIDSAKLRAWDSNYGAFGHRNYPKCFSRSRFDFYFIFNTDSLGLSNMASMINNVPAGNFILVYTFRDGNFANWTEPAYQAMENIGASSVRIINSPRPYIFFVKKGNLSTKQEIVGATDSSEIDLFVNLISTFTYGEIKSEKVGPAKKWKSFHWNQSSNDITNYDSVRVDIIGINAFNSNEDLVYRNISVNELNILNLEDSIDYNIYPNVKLNFYTKDDSVKTPSQLKKWQLMFDEAPETAINPKEGFSFYKDTVNEGDEIRFKIATQNISAYDMDSLLVRYWIIDKNNNTVPIITKKLRKHNSGDILIDSISFLSKNLVGLNSLWLEFNPVNAFTGKYDQLEQFHFNNVAQKFFYVNSDKINPLLDVTFDGFHILNGDIVSAKPQILIKLKDENKFLALDDTSSFAVYLKKINNQQISSEGKRIYFIDSLGNQVLDWIPAQLPNNSCKIIYNPILDDGKYELRIQAKDVSSNESGINDYNIMFEVITKSSITEIFNYPNPFSTSTRFVFTLTGSEIPDELTIQILTVTGKLVKVVDLHDIGNVHIGRNITDYAWDGKDMYGDQLANGVYFYKVITKLNGKDIDKRITGAENFFKKGFGKMYLMR